MSRMCARRPESSYSLNQQRERAMAGERRRSMTRRQRAVVLAKATMCFAVCFFVVAPSAGAQIIDVDTATFAKLRGLADDARKLHPTAPDKAEAVFSDAFDTTFGNLIVLASHVWDQPSLRISIETLDRRLRNQVAAALRRLDQLPTAPADPPPVVIVTVYPRRANAPNVSKIVLFRDDTPVEPSSTTLALREFKTNLGSAQSFRAPWCSRSRPSQARP